MTDVLLLFPTIAVWLAAAGWTLFMLWRHLPARLTDWGTHLLRIALLFLLPALGLSLLSGYSEDLVLAAGQREHSPAGVSLELEEIRDTPSSRESRLRILQPGRDAWSGDVAVKDPLRIGPYRLHQLGFEQRPAVLLEHNKNSGPSRHPDREILLAEHEGFRHDGVFWILARDTRQPSNTSKSTDDAWFFRGRSEGGGELRMALSEGAKALGMQPAGSETKTLSRLRLVANPGALPAAAAAILLLGGTLLLGLRAIGRKTRGSRAAGVLYPLLTAGLLLLPGLRSWQYDGTYWGWSWPELAALAAWLLGTAFIIRYSLSPSCSRALSMR